MKTLAVLEALAEAPDPIRLGQIAEGARTTKPTAHRILQTLLRAGYVSAVGDGHYAPGPRLLGLAGRALRHGEYLQHVRPILRDLQERSGYTVHFALLAGNEAVYVEKVEPRQAYQMASRVGMRVPLHCTSIGQAILAELPVADARERLGPEPYAERTDSTLCSWPALEPALDEVRRTGYAIDDEENETDVRCVGAAVFDSGGQVSGAISVSGLAFLFSLEDAHEIGPQVRAAARRVSESLGAPAKHSDEEAPA